MSKLHLMHSILLHRSLLSAAAACAMVAAPGAQAASDISFHKLAGAEYETGGVYVRGEVHFLATDDDGEGRDSIYFVLDDDQQRKFQATYSAPVGEWGIGMFEVYYAAEVLSGSPGVGLGVLDLPDQSQWALVKDPYLLPRYMDPSECSMICGPVPAVPEPAEYALMLVGLAGVAGAVRHRRSREATAR